MSYMFFQVANLYSAYYRFFKHMLQFCYKHVFSVTLTGAPVCKPPAALRLLKVRDIFI